MAEAKQHPSREWTDMETALLRKCYPTMTGKQLAALLPGRTVRAILAKARELKIKKTKHPPRFWRPIGSERMDRGYLIRKVTDTGNPKKDWKRVEVIEWEALNGPIPEGMMLMVKNPALPRTLENMGLFTHAQHWERVSIHHGNPELRQLYQLKGQITQAINRRLTPRRKAP